MAERSDDVAAALEVIGDTLRSIDEMGKTQDSPIGRVWEAWLRTTMAEVTRLDAELSAIGEEIHLGMTPDVPLRDAVARLRDEKIAAQQSLRDDRAASHLVIEGLRTRAETAERRAEKAERSLETVRYHHGAGRAGVSYDVTRPVPLIALHLAECAASWHGDTFVLGDVRAREVEYLAKWAYAAYCTLEAAVEHRPPFIGEDDFGAASLGAICCPYGEPAHFWKDGCPACCAAVMRVAQGLEVPVSTRVHVAEDDTAEVPER